MDILHISYARCLLAMYVMILIFMEIEHFTSHVWLNRALIVVLMFLNGLGIYIGRF